MTNLKELHQRPEGRLIEEALSRPPKKSQRQLAKDIQMSEGRVRQIINGYQSQGGQVLNIVGPAETVARMALAAGVSAEELDSVGRSDAGDVIRQERATNPHPETVEGRVAVLSIFEEIKQWIEGVPAGTWPGHPPEEVITFFSTEHILDLLRRRVDGQRETARWQIDRYRAKVAEVEELKRQIAELKGGDGNADDTGRTAPNTNVIQLREDVAAHDDPENPPGEPED